MAILDRTKLGAALGSIADKSAYSRAFQSTPLAGLVGRVIPTGKSDSSKKEKPAREVTKPSASGMQISEETVKVLESIDQNFKDILDSLEVNRQREEAAKEEASTEATAMPLPPSQDTGEGGGGFGKSLLSKFGKFASFITVLAVQFAYPLYKAMSGVIDTVSEAFGKVKKFLQEKIVPIFTETIPEFFTETIPNFFTETLPNLFFDGVGWIKDKFSSILDMFSSAVAGIKKKVGGFIIDISESGAAKLILSDETRASIRSYGENMVKSGDKTLTEIEQKKAEKERQAQEAPATGEAAAAAKTGAPPTPTAPAEPIRTGEKKLTPFEIEFAKQRSLQGPGGVFTWTDPVTGKTGKYTTNYKEEDPASSVSKSDVEPPSSTETPRPLSGGAAPSMSMSGPSGSSSATPEAAAPTSSGAAVSSASMAVSAPEGGSSPSAVAQNSSANMNKPKIPADEVNPVANVPNVDPILGSIANLWYHNSAVVLS